MLFGRPQISLHSPTRCARTRKLMVDTSLNYSENDNVHLHEVAIFEHRKRIAFEHQMNEKQKSSREEESLVQRSVLGPSRKNNM